MFEKIIESIASNFPDAPKAALMETLVKSPHGCGACAHAEWGAWTRPSRSRINGLWCEDGGREYLFSVIGCRAGLINQLPVNLVYFKGDADSAIGRNPVEYCTAQNANLGRESI